MKLKDKIAIVTGGAQNIGKGIVIELLGEGAKVVIADLESSCGAKTAAELDPSGQNVVFIPTDVTDEGMVVHLIEETVARFGKLDILVNNAGILVPQIPFEETTTEYFEKIINVNLKGVFLCTRESIKKMLINGGGSIITISSSGGIKPREGMVSYAASKAGALLLTQVAAKEFATRGIRANIIAPGPIDAGSNIEPELVPVFLADVPTKTFGTPKDIGRAVVFFASEDAKQITGAVMPVDGGRIIR